MNAVVVSRGVPESSIRPFGVAGTVAVVVGLLLIGWLYWFTTLAVDVGQVQGRTQVQLHFAALRFQEWAAAHGGVYPSSGEDAERLLAPTPAFAPDPWGRPFRYERLAGEGSLARVFSLGKDGKPGGTRSDEDTVLWMSAAGLSRTRDVGAPPGEWR